MDIALKNGDFALNSSGKVYSISAMEETIQRCMVLLKVKQGSFSYNRKLGSNIHLLKVSDKNLFGNATLLVKEALAPLVQVKVEKVETEIVEDKIILNIEISAYGEKAKIEVNV